MHSETAFLNRLRFWTPISARRASRSSWCRRTIPSCGCRWIALHGHGLGHSPPLERLSEVPLIRQARNPSSGHRKAHSIMSEYLGETSETSKARGTALKTLPLLEDPFFCMKKGAGSPAPRLVLRTSKSAFRWLCRRCGPLGRQRGSSSGRRSWSRG